MRRLWALALLGTAGCFTSVPDVLPIDPEGHYLMFVENAENGCGFMGFDRPAERPRMMDPSVEFSLYRDGSSTKIKGQFEGAAALVFVFWFGSRELTGTVDGNKIEIRPQALNAQMQGNCKYILDVRGHATADKARNLVDGVVRYRATMLSGHPDCKPLEGCETTQLFRATRTGDPTTIPDGGI
jgi:hypothetical protein